MSRHRSNPVLMIAGLVLLAVLFLLDMQGRVFLTGFKTGTLDLIRDKIGLEGTIGGLEGGVFRGIILRDVTLYSPEAEEGRKEVFFSAVSIELDYRLWDVVLGHYDGLDRITFSSPKIFFPGKDMKWPVPRIFDPAWEGTTISVVDGSLYNAQQIPVISGVTGNFRIDADGIESRRISASVMGQSFIGSGKVGFPLESKTVKLEGSVKGKGYSLNAKLDGVLDKVFVHGSFDIFDTLNCNFAGNVDTSSERTVYFSNFRFGPQFLLNGLLHTEEKGFSFDLFPEDTKGNATAMGEISKLAVSGDLSRLPLFTLDICANHIKVFGFDIMSNYEINGKLDYGKDGELESVSGDFATSGSLINYDPVREVKGAYEFKDGRLKFTGVNYGEVLVANGSVCVGDEKDLELHMKFRGTQLGGLTDLATEKGMISGTVFGDLYVKGELGGAVKIDGQLDLINGNISIIHYNSAKITVRGAGTRLEFIDSKVYTDDNTLMLEGYINLADLCTPRVFNNIEIKSDPSTVVWAGASVTQTPTGGDEYVTGANLNEQFRVNFKTYEAQKVDQQRPRQNEMELEYKLGNPANLKVRMKEDDEFIGVEHKVRF